MPDMLQLIGLGLREGSPFLVQWAKEYIQGDSLEKTSAIQKASFAKIHSVLQDSPIEEECETCKLGGHESMKEVVGHKTWVLLHSVASSLPEHPDEATEKRVKSFVSGIIQNFPCRPCAQDAETYLESHPLDYSSSKGLVKSLCRLHDSINAKTGKPLHGCK